jgi:hypothetical protein
MTRISKEFIQNLVEVGSQIIREKVTVSNFLCLSQHLPNSKENLIGILIEREADRHLKILEDKYHTLKDQELELIVSGLIREISQAMESGKGGIKIILASTFAAERLEKLIYARRNLVAFVEKVLSDQGITSSGKGPLVVASLGGIVQTLVFRKENNLTDEDFIQEATKMIIAYIRTP